MLVYTTLSGLIGDVSIFYNWLSPYFAPDTADEGTSPALVAVDQCAGHCAVAAIILQGHFGGKLVSNRVSGYSHWFNRLEVQGLEVDVDITGAQFSLPLIQAGPADSLYEGTANIRAPDDISPETANRALLLATRASLVLKPD